MAGSVCVCVCVAASVLLLLREHVQDVPVGPGEWPLSVPHHQHLPAVIPQVKRFKSEGHLFPAFQWSHPD